MNQTREHLIMLDFERNIALIKHDPGSWFLYSGQAFEVIYELENSGDKYTEHMRQTLDLALNSIGIKLGCQGQDQYGRNIILDYYGTSYETTLVSLDYASKKAQQYKRIRAILRVQYQNTQKELDKINRRIYRYTHDTSKNYIVGLNKSLLKRHEIEHKLSRIDKRSELAYSAIMRLELALQVEFYRLQHITQQ